MTNYTPYPTSKTTPSRKSRKQARNRIFTENKLKHRQAKEDQKK